MGYRKEDKYIIYPLYFDATLSRKQGRRIPKNLCIEKPEITQISKSAKNLGFNPFIEEQSSHPRHHWKHNGRIFIDKKQSKQSMIKQIAHTL